MWSELCHNGLDVLCALCGAMDTPSLRKLLDERNLPTPPLLQPADVVADMLALLGKKTVHITLYAGNVQEALQVEEQRKPIKLTGD